MKISGEMMINLSLTLGFVLTWILMFNSGFHGTVENTLNDIDKQMEP